MKTYNEFINSHNIENIDIQKILEGNFYNEYKSLKDKIVKDLKVNLYFLSTFSTSVEAFFPIVKNICDGQFQNITFSSQQIVLLTIAALAILFNENNENIKKLKLKLEKENITEDMLNNIISNIKSFRKLFNIIAKNFGKIISSISDMFVFTALLVPTMHIILKLINSNDLTTSDFNSLLIALTTGVITLGMKNSINILINKIKFAIQNTFKYTNKDSSIPINKHKEFK